MQPVSSSIHKLDVFQQARLDLARLRTETSQRHRTNDEILASQEKPDLLRAAIAKTQEGILRQGGA